ncbi:MAG: DUF2020 domain-containing protein [Pseudonocardiaceae bacterium]
MSIPCRVTRVLTAVCGLLLAGIGACGGPARTPADPTDLSVPSAVAPPAPQPSAEGPCPYLDQEDVAVANGQLVGSVRTSTDRPHPACFFFRGDGTEQLRTWIVVATPEVAGATVDAAAPVATSDLAELPRGWSGGSQPTSSGAVFAVARQGTAVVITTNQQQTIGARRIAEQVIAALGG